MKVNIKEEGELMSQNPYEETIARKICRNFKNVSRKVWNTLRESKEFGVSTQEETITENSLLELSKKLSGKVHVRSFNKTEEGINGSDFQWIILWGDDWLGFKVQAKILKERKYKSMFSSDSQFLKLIGSAYENEFIPAYCFYNYPHEDDLIAYMNKKGLNFNGGQYPIDFELLGWTFCNALDIQGLYQVKKQCSFEELIPHIDLVSELVCIDKFKDYMDRSNDLKDKLHKDIDEYLSREKITKPKIDIRKRDQLPDYVKDMLNIKYRTSNSFKLDVNKVFVLELEPKRKDQESQGKSQVRKGESVRGNRNRKKSIDSQSRQPITNL